MAYIDIGGGRSVELAEPRRDQFKNNLGGAVEYSLAHLLYSVCEHMGGGLGSFVASFAVKFLERIEPECVDYVRPIIDDILAIPGLPDGFRQMLEKLRSPSSFAGGALLAGLGTQAAGVAAGSLINSLLARPTLYLNTVMRATRPDPSAAYAMLWRGLITPDEKRVWLEESGWNDRLIAAFEQLYRVRPAVADLIAHSYRIQSNPEGARAELKKRGADDAAIDKIFELSHVIPGPGDLVTFALREVWRTDLRPELLSPNAPGEYYDWMAKQGYSQHFAENYWASHWALPSVRQGFEMFWRIPEFGEGDLRSLLTRLDILPRYHDDLIKIAYAPWTRVDIRRMHKLGVIPDRAGLEEAYGDIGYHGKQLAGICDFTVLYNQEEERDFTRTDIIAAYEIGRFTRSEALGALVSIGYSEVMAGVWLSKADLSRANKYARERIAQVKTLYRGKRLTRTQAHTQLTNIPIPSAEADTYLELWDVGREAIVGRPSKAELRRFFIQNILKESEFRTELAGHHLSDTYIDWYVDDAKLDLVDAMKKEAERARKEEERIVKAEVRIERDIALAHLDVQIADYNTAIADIKLAMKGALPEATILGIREEIATEREWLAAAREAKRASLESLDIEIATLTTEFAEVRVTIAEALLPEAEIEALKVHLAEIRATIAGLREERMRTVALWDIEIAPHVVRVATLQLSIATGVSEAMLGEMEADIAGYKTEIERVKREKAAVRREYLQELAGE